MILCIEGLRCIEKDHVIFHYSKLLNAKVYQLDREHPEIYDPYVELDLIHKVISIVKNNTFDNIIITCSPLCRIALVPHLESYIQSFSKYYGIFHIYVPLKWYYPESIDGMYAYVSQSDAELTKWDDIVIPENEC